MNPRRLLSIVLFFLVAAPAASVFAAPTPVAPTPGASAAPTTATAKADSPADIAAEVATEAKSADSLWEYIKKWSDLSDLENLDASLDPQTRMNVARDLVHAKVAHLRPAVDEFLKRYGTDPRHWKALLLRVSFLREEEGIPEDSVNNTLQQIAHAPDAPLDVKREARGALLQDTLEKSDPAAGLTDALEKELSSYEKDFPDDPAGAQLVTLRLRLLHGTPEKIAPTLALLSKSPNKSTAEAASKQLDILTKPVELKLTTLDGKELDFAKLRGKVVLLDFWATWCAPCMAKLPEIVAIDKKYQGKDFQLVGISLDENKHTLEETLKEKGMGWPQVFDPKGGEGEVPVRFNVEAIPTTWLIDKKGFAHEIDREADLDAEIGKALGEGSGDAKKQS